MAKKLVIPSKSTLVELYENQKLSTVEVGKELGVSYATVIKWLKHHEIRKRSQSEEQKNRFVKHNPYKIEIPEDTLRRMLVDDSMGIDDVASHFNVSRELIDKRKQEYGIYTGNRYPSYGSKAQAEIYDYCLSLDAGTVNNDRSILSNDKEIDVFLPKSRLGIEYCGLFWHSENSAKAYKQEWFHRKGHFNKCNECDDIGINLLTIFEDEWNTKQDIIKSMIAHKCGKSPIRLFARKTDFRPVDKKTTRSFLNENHLQGSPQWISESYGLYDDNTLVAVVTYANHHRNNTDYVLNRLCFKKGVSVVGGASKLIKKSIKSGCISWSDRRWSDGGVYKATGFILENSSNPDYSYTNNNVRKSKQSFSKKDIDSDWGRIWDCGKDKWVYP